MRSAATTSVWAALGVASVTALLALYPACTAQTTERRGGGDIPDLTSGSGIAPGEAGAGGDSGESGVAGDWSKGPPTGNE